MGLLLAPMCGLWNSSIVIFSTTTCSSTVRRSRRGLAIPSTLMKEHRLARQYGGRILQTPILCWRVIDRHPCRNPVSFRFRLKKTVPHTRPVKCRVRHGDAENGRAQPKPILGHACFLPSRSVGTLLASQPRLSLDARHRIAAQSRSPPNPTLAQPSHFFCSRHPANGKRVNSPSSPRSRREPVNLGDDPPVTDATSIPRDVA